MFYTFLCRFLYISIFKRDKRDSFLHNKSGGDKMCHKTKTINHEKNTKPRNAEIDPKEIAEPLPESTRERRDGPGGD